MRILSIVVAFAENWAIGKDNQLLWHLPNDLKYFKNLTTGHSIIMGRKTYESIGRALPNRRNIVITQQKEWTAPGIEVANSLEQALALTEKEKEVFIIGGGKVYAQALNIAQKIYATRVHALFEADTFFPEISEKDWEITQQQGFKPDEKNPYAYSIQTLERRKI